MARRSKTFLGTALAAMTMLALAPQLASASVISDCTADNSIDGRYSASELRDALRNMPADVDQYYGCSDLIRQELLNNVDKHDNDKNNGDSNESLTAATTPEQREQARRNAESAVQKALPKAGASVAVDGESVERSGAKTLASSASPGTPAAMVIALIGLLLLFLGDLAARRAKMPDMKKFLPGSRSTDDTP